MAEMCFILKSRETSLLLDYVNARVGKNFGKGIIVSTVDEKWRNENGECQWPVCREIIFFSITTPS